MPNEIIEGTQFSSIRTNSLGNIEINADGKKWVLLDDKQILILVNEFAFDVINGVATVRSKFYDGEYFLHDNDKFDEELHDQIDKEEF